MIPDPAGRVEDLRHDVRRQRLARAGGRRPERHRGRRPRTPRAAPPLPPCPLPTGASRLEQLVEANVLGTQAFQVALAKKDGKGDPACYSPGSLTDAALAALETHQAALLKVDVKAVRAWAEGRPSTFDPSSTSSPFSPRA